MMKTIDSIAQSRSRPNRREGMLVVTRAVIHFSRGHFHVNGLGRFAAAGGFLIEVGFDYVADDGERNTAVTRVFP